MAGYLGSGREVAESCMDFLNLELVSCYQRQVAIRPDLAGRRIESIGFQVGQQLAERYTKDRARFADHLDVIKFICKDFWAEIFQKQVDNLKTNHKGVFVLQDNRFRWLLRVSPDPVPNSSSPSSPGTEQPPQQASLRTSLVASQYLYFPCGIVRGALTSLGVPCGVSAEVLAPPACSFTIRIKQ